MVVLEGSSVTCVTATATVKIEGAAQLICAVLMSKDDLLAVVEMGRKSWREELKVHSLCSDTAPQKNQTCLSPLRYAFTFTTSN